MSRYASGRGFKSRLRPGYSRGWIGVQYVDPRTLAASSDPEAYRRLTEQSARRIAVGGYNAARSESLQGPSFRWMKPHGRPRYRWVTRTWDLIGEPHTVLELTCVVYPEGALP